MVTGRIDGGLPAYLILAFSCVAAFTDFLWGRIFNWFTAPMFLAGLAAAAYWGGWLHLSDSLLAAVVALLAYGWMFFLGFLGGGDVKFLMALGAWGGVAYVLEVAVFAVLVGGAMALVILVAKGRFASFARRMQVFFLTLVVKELELAPPELDRSLTMPFGIPISIAAVWVAFAHPLKDAFMRMGVHL